jgi:tRNA-dihydrouridine synthase
MPAPPNLAEQREVILEHFHRVREGHPEKKAIGYFRKFMVGYARRHPKRKQVLLTLMKADTAAQVEADIDAWYIDFPLDTE